MDLTLLNINEVYELPAGDFLSYCTYNKLEIERNNRQVEAEMLKYKNRRK